MTHMHKVMKNEESLSKLPLTCGEKVHSDGALPASFTCPPFSTLLKIYRQHKKNLHLHLSLQNLPISLHFQDTVSFCLGIPKFSIPTNTRSEHTLTAYFLIGKCVCFFFCFSVTIPASCLLNLLRIARVVFGRRSSGRYFFFW